MNRKKRSLFASFFLVLIIGMQLVAPSAVYAGFSFRKLFRSIRRGTSFVVNLPSKATRFLGPTLGPIAADIISINLGKNPRFGSFLNKARRLNKITNNIEEQNKAINELKQIYQDQAADLDKRAAEVRKVRKSLAAELIKGNITREEHLDRVADLEALAQTYEATADRLRRSGSRLNPAHIIKILGTDFFNNSVVKIRNLIKHELNDELSRVLKPDVIKSLLEGNDPNRLLEVLLSDELNELKNTPGFDFDKFKQELLEKIQKMIKEDSENLKDNWRQRMQDIITAEFEDQKIESKPTKKPEPSQTSNQAGSGGSDGDDISRCDSGYVFIARSGVGCVQQDCKEGKVSNAHLGYTGNCVCGSAGSINENPDDPNKACYRDLSYESCPGCVYACVHSNEECPD